MPSKIRFQKMESRHPGSPKFLTPRFSSTSQRCPRAVPQSFEGLFRSLVALAWDIVTVTFPPICLRYLCDFTYYTSLYQGRGRSAFVHVPPLGKPYNADQLGRALRAIIEEMLGVLEQAEGDISCCRQL